MNVIYGDGEWGGTGNVKYIVTVVMVMIIVKLESLLFHFRRLPDAH